jgi:hypothetical protein
LKYTTYITGRMLVAEILIMHMIFFHWFDEIIFDDMQKHHINYKNLCAGHH